MSTTTSIRKPPAIIITTILPIPIPMLTDLLASIYHLISLLPFSALQANFMQRATLEILLLAPLCSMMGTLTIQFRMAFFADAVAHSAFTGIALGILLGIDPWATLVVFGVFVGVSTTRLRRKADMAMDTTLGVLFSTTVALGLAIISMKKGLGKTLPGFLYGDILAVTDNDILATFCLFLFVSGFLFCFFNRLLFIGLHENLAEANGIKAGWLETLFAALLALVTAFAIRAVGILLVTALLIIPAAAANNIARSIAVSVWLAILFSIIAGLGGLAISVTFDLATGASMILLASGMFFVSLLARRS